MSMHVAFLPLPILGTVNFVTVGSFSISIQLVAGSNYGEAHELNTCTVFTFKSVFLYEVYT
jgi:hypothetical protein